MKFVTNPQMSSESIGECGGPTAVGSANWEGKSTRSGDFIHSDQAHDNLGYRTKTDSANDHRKTCNTLDIEEIMIRSAVDLVSSEIKHFIHDIELVPLPASYVDPAPPHKRLALKDCTVPQRDAFNLQINSLLAAAETTGKFYAHTTTDTWEYPQDKAQEGDLTHYKYWKPTAARENKYGSALKATRHDGDSSGSPGIWKMPYFKRNEHSMMGSSVFSQYMEKFWNPGVADISGLYFHTITDCGPALATQTRSTSNDLDSANASEERGYYYHANDQPPYPTQPNIYTIMVTSPKNSTTTKKHRALAQHMMIRILFDDEPLYTRITGFDDAAGAAPQIGRREELTDETVHRIQKTHPFKDDDFLLQDLYSNWIWQLTLIHIFNVKYKIDESNIALTTVETTHDLDADGSGSAAATAAVYNQDHEKKANLAAFFRLSRLSFYMGDTGKLQCIVREDHDTNGDGTIDTSDKNKRYQNVVNLFFTDFWQPLLNIHRPASSVSWLKHAKTLPHSDFNISQQTVSGFMTDAFKSGGVKSGLSEIWFEGFVDTNLSGLSIHNHTVPAKQDAKYEAASWKKTVTIREQASASVKPDLTPRNKSLPARCFPFTNPRDGSLSNPFKLHVDQFATAADDDAKYLEQRVQLLTVQLLKTLGDQSHLVDFMTKSEYLDPNSIRPILQIKDRPLEALSLRYLNMKTSYGIIITDAQKVFVRDYAMTQYNTKQGKNLEVKRRAAGSMASPEQQAYGHDLDPTISHIDHFKSGWTSQSVIAWTAEAEHTTPHWTTHSEALSVVGSSIFSGWGANHQPETIAMAATIAMAGAVSVVLVLGASVGLWGGGGPGQGGGGKDMTGAVGRHVQRVLDEQRTDEWYKHIFKYELLAQQTIEFLNMGYTIKYHIDDRELSLDEHIKYIIAYIMVNRDIPKNHLAMAVNAVEEEKKVFGEMERKGAGGGKVEELYANIREAFTSASFNFERLFQLGRKWKEVAPAVNLHLSHALNDLLASRPPGSGDGSDGSIDAQGDGSIAEGDGEEADNDDDDEDESDDDDDEEDDGIVIDPEGDDAEDDDPEDDNISTDSDTETNALDVGIRIDTNTDTDAQGANFGDGKLIDQPNSWDDLEQWWAEVAGGGGGQVNYTELVDAAAEEVDPQQAMLAIDQNKIPSDTRQHNRRKTKDRRDDENHEPPSPTPPPKRPKQAPPPPQWSMGAKAWSGPLPNNSRQSQKKPVPTDFVNSPRFTAVTNTKVGRRTRAKQLQDRHKSAASGRESILAPMRGQGQPKAQPSKPKGFEPLNFGGGGKLIKNKRSKKYKKTKRGKKSRRVKKSHKKKKVKYVKKSRKCVKKSRKGRNTRRKRHHSKKL